MSIGLFTDKTNQPTTDEVNAAIGLLLPMWQELVQFIQENYAVEEDFKFLYGKKYGWARRFRVKGKLLASLYPTENSFTVQLNLSPEAIEQAQQMSPGQSVLQAIAAAYPYPEGRWLFIPICSKDDVKDVRRLLALRAEMIGIQKR